MSHLTDKLTETTTKYYEDVLIDSISKPTFGVKYRKTKAPTYLTVRVPFIKRHTCCDCDDSETNDEWVIYLKEVKLFKIGSHIEEVPYYPKKKASGGVIKFSRYSEKL